MKGKFFLKTYLDLRQRIYYYEISNIQDSGNKYLRGAAMKSSHLLVGTLIAITAAPITASGQSNLTFGTVGYDYYVQLYQLVITAIVINNDTYPSDSCYISFFLEGTDPPYYIFLGERFIPPIPDFSGTGLTFSTYCSPYLGSWWIGIIIDYTDMVNESNEMDNEWHSTIPLQLVIPPNAPILKYPLSDATGIPVDPILRWEYGGGGMPDLYWIEVYDDLGACVYSNSTNIKQQQVGPLSYNTMYSWKVYAENIAGASPYSEEWSFTTEVGIGIGENHTEIPHAFALTPPYPNPFNTVTKIALDLPESSIVRLKIHDMLGREIETLIDGPIAAGEHEIVWHAEGLTSGIHLCHFEADGFVETRKLILQR